MTTYTRQLEDEGSGLDEVGAKRQSLARLVQAGLAVPRGFHVTTAAYREFVNPNGLLNGIQSALAAVDPDRQTTLETASARTGTLFADHALPGQRSTPPGSGDILDRDKSTPRPELGEHGLVRPG
jgi:pyruvate,water dikinase